MSKLLLTILYQQRKQLDLLHSQISALSLSEDQSDGIRSLTPLQREFRELDDIANILIKQYKNELIDGTDTQPIPTPIIRYSLRVASNSVRAVRNSIAVIKENRIKILILVLAIVAGLVTRESKWIGTLFSNL